MTEWVTVFDTETTGLVINRTMRLSAQPEVIEFYAIEIDLDSEENGEEVDLLIKPENWIREKTTQITAITQEMVETSPPFKQVADRVLSLLVRHPRLIAHNVRFDMEMIEIEMERLGRKVTWPEPTCTVEQSMHYAGKRLSLGDLHLHLFGEKFTGAHRARVDVAALCRVAREMRRRNDL